MWRAGDDAVLHPIRSCAARGNTRDGCIGVRAAGVSGAGEEGAFDEPSVYVSWRELDVSSRAAEGRIEVPCLLRSLRTLQFVNFED